MSRRRGRGGRQLSEEERRAHFWRQEQENDEKWNRLTKNQKLHPKWQEYSRQRQNAARLGLVLLLAGEEVPEPLARVLDAESRQKPVFGLTPTPSPVSGLFEPETNVESDPTGGGMPWGSRWGFPWRRSTKGER
jgi:hypothetical protein